LSRVQRDSLWVAIGPRGNNGNARRSFAFAQAFGRRSIPLNHAGLTEQSRRGPNAAPTRQAGGHWFEPSTAHRKALQKSRCCLLSRRRDVVGWQRLCLVAAPQTLSTPEVFAGCRGNTRGVRARSVVRPAPYHGGFAARCYAIRQIRLVARFPCNSSGFSPEGFQNAGSLSPARR